MQDREERPRNYHVPVGIEWQVGDKRKPKFCCGIKRAVPEAIQFARAAIDGPNGRQGKPWTLDIPAKEVENAPEHDPIYPLTKRHRRTRRVGERLTQWDAPGMPEGLYKRLLHAEGKSHYRQQFFSLLVCRPEPVDEKERLDFYLSQAKDKQIGITTVTWTFPGQRGRNRKDPKNLSKAKVEIDFSARDGDCHSLQDVLELYELLNAFKSPKRRRASLGVYA